MIPQGAQVKGQTTLRLTLWFTPQKILIALCLHVDNNFIL